MSEAPERVWLTHPWQMSLVSKKRTVEYVRADKLEELAAEVERCHARLEIDRHYIPNETGDDFVEVSIPLHEREKFPDGIEARDATIKGQDEQLLALRKWRQEYVGKLTISEAALAEAKRENEALWEALKLAEFMLTKDSLCQSERLEEGLTVIRRTRNAGGNDAE